MKRNFYFLSEIEYREYLQRLLLACEIHNDDEIYIMQFKQLNKYFKNFKPGIVFLNEANFTKREKILRMKKAGYKFILYHAESTATYNYFQSAYMFYDHKLLDIVEYILCLGQKQKELLIKFYPAIKKKIIITGDIKYDIPRKKYNYVLENQIKSIKKKYKKKFILIPSNFSTATWKYINKGKLYYDPKMHKFSKYNKTEFLKWKKGEIADKKHEYKRLFEYVEAIKLISKKFQNLDIIVRPHPVDHPLFWSNVFNEKNIFIEFSYDIKAWIKASEFSISNACSSVIENFFLNKKSLCYFPNFKKKHDKKFYYNICLNSKSTNELISHIEQAIKNKRSIKKKLNKSYIYYDNNLSLNKKFRILNKINIVSQKNSKLVELYIKCVEIIKYLMLKFRTIEYMKDKKKWSNNHNLEYSNIVKKFSLKSNKKLNFKKIGPYITKIY